MFRMSMISAGLPDVLSANPTESLPLAKIRCGGSLGYMSLWGKLITNALLLNDCNYSWSTISLWRILMRIVWWINYVSQTREIARTHCWSEEHTCFSVLM